ncbi:PREDICTED: zinc finger CCCH domain-containing protein 10-like [Priapulus caudatus]|uniref:Zinc finger CCCH domain-containing protein 10-like n=1 Tax=Priapulus caudatus TaxID=37621 RepID=A0ABM1EL36_PRICU|nr:PREDICTED: zinc finger CCCH domain-containing protein 10-like [Priapulus caudatus]XP_014672907.1 PREDICTED: zinc finger CCCH domain-containing protein 10-like [Priapulus caudatus]XP_014672908.1 PREDICTED: zinc finger CCCH domain-containing protein 10-like [Priapulus caudatus]
MDNGDGENIEEENTDSYCRDFMRNICTRGQRCKYRHPTADELGEMRPDIEFCHDFQNKECHRVNCKFTHCTKEEEVEYRASGQLPEHIRKGMQVGLNVADASRGEIPVCKDYQKGECNRGGKCRYRHVDYREELDGADRPPIRPFERYTPYDAYDPYEQDRFAPKRRHFDESYNDGSGAGSAPYAYSGPMRPTTVEWQQMKDEITVWRGKCAQFEKQITELKAKNDILMDQNTRLQQQAQITTAASMQTQAIAQMAQNAAVLGTRERAEARAHPVDCLLPRSPGGGNAGADGSCRG